MQVTCFCSVFCRPLVSMFTLRPTLRHKSRNDEMTAPDHPTYMLAELARCAILRRLGDVSGVFLSTAGRAQSVLRPAPSPQRTGSGHRRYIVPSGWSPCPGSDDVERRFLLTPRLRRRTVYLVYHWTVGESPCWNQSIVSWLTSWPSARAKRWSILRCWTGELRPRAEPTNW